VTLHEQVRYKGILQY